ncbi:MAG: MoxR family ATPase [Alphaproteobacteria bacterium]|nr:MoxR family ATPase [Alphaproteobacteria bacterium]
MLMIEADDLVKIGDQSAPNHCVHCFDRKDIDAVNSALAARRPLLLRGEPGVGKTQLAAAAAVALGYGFVHTTVDASTEARDLRWTEDLVDRLSDAQRAAQAGAVGAGKYLEYVEPGPLWWAFSWNTAVQQSAKRNKVADKDAPKPPQPDRNCSPEKGMVVLIDEIDKSEPELPNSLLEALGAREFSVKERHEPVRAITWPLVIVTTNQSRILPDAFLRRCLVHDMALPGLDKLEDFFVGRGRQHLPDAPTELLVEIARQTVADRRRAEQMGLSPKPGQAEFLDFARAAVELKANSELLKRIAPFFLRKHRELHE